MSGAVLAGEPVAAGRGRERTVVATTSAVLVFAQATVFAALGIALFAMADDFHWSAAQAGGAFTVQVVACCVAALWPVPMIRWIGARWTMAAGCAVLGAGFLLAAATGGLATLYAAAALIGVGFSLCANTPGLYMIAGWSGPRAPRMIGLYLMIGALGSGLGPPAAQAIIAGVGWRGYWLAMAIGAALLAVACAIALREPPTPGAEAAGAATGLREVLRSPLFVILALAMVMTQACLITVASVTPAHLAARGWTVGFAAALLGAQGLAGALATGLSGFLTRHLSPRRMLALSLLLEAAGMALLAAANGRWAAYAFVPCFGIGSCVTSLAVTVLLVRYFGDAGGTAGLAMIWTLSGAAAFGPWLAGLVADATGGFAPALAGLGVLLLPIAAATLALPQEAGAGAQGGRADG